MTMTISGTAGVTYPDSTTQATAPRIGGTTTSSAVDITLNSSSTQVQIVTMTAADKAVILPNATTLIKGECVFEITASPTSYLFTVKNASGDIVFGPVFAGTSVSFTLTDNSTSAGSWNVTANGAVARGGFGPVSVSTLAAFQGLQVYGQDIRVIGLTSTTALITYMSATATLSAVVATLSGTSVTFGTAVTVSTSAYADFITSAVGLSSTLAVASYVTSGGSVQIKALSVSGTTITVGTAATITTITSPGSSSNRTMQLLKLTTTSGLATYAGDDGTNVFSGVRAFSISGTTITLGSATTLYTVASGPNVGAKSVVTSSNSFVSLYMISSGAGLQLRAFTFSGTTLTAGTAVNVGISDGSNNSSQGLPEPWVYYQMPDSCYSPATNSALFFNQYLTGLIVTTSGTTVSAYTSTQVYDPIAGYVTNANYTMVPFGSSGQALALFGQTILQGVSVVCANSAGIQGVSRPFPNPNMRAYHVGFLDTQSAIVAGIATSGTNTYLTAQLLKVI